MSCTSNRRNKNLIPVQMQENLPKFQRNRLENRSLKKRWHSVGVTYSYVKPVDTWPSKAIQLLQQKRNLSLLMLLVSLIHFVFSHGKYSLTLPSNRKGPLSMADKKCFLRSLINTRASMGLTLPRPLRSWKQVWPPTQFFLFPFCKKKTLICLEGKSMTPCQGTSILFRSFSS